MVLSVRERIELCEFPWDGMLVSLLGHDRGGVVGQVTHLVCVLRAIIHRFVP